MFINSFLIAVFSGSTYELPYTTKLEAARAEPFTSKMDAKSDRSDSSSSTTTDRPSKKSNKNKNATNKAKMNGRWQPKGEMAEEGLLQ